MSRIEGYAPHHVTVRAEDTDGNGGLGRYWLIPGCMNRAKELAARLEKVVVRESPRGHHAHLGQMVREGQSPVDVGVISTGMGCPSVDIIVTELIKLGARRFLRVGSAGGLQPHRGVDVGSVVIATGGVRDDGTSRHYAPMEVASLASPLMVEALQRAAIALGPEIAGKTFCGLVHTKDSLMARELHEGCMGEEHRKYMKGLRRIGVLASEMECAHLFILAAAHSHSPNAVHDPSAPYAIASVGSSRSQSGVPPAGASEVLAGCVCGVVGSSDDTSDAPFACPERQAQAIAGASAVAMEALLQLARLEGV